MNIVFNIVFVSVILTSTAFAFNPAEHFSKKCMSCHTIGKGDDVGPDLKDVTKKRDKKWLIRFIRESQTMIEEGDALANELFSKHKKKKMPDQELDDDEMEALLKFIEVGKVVESASKIKSAFDSNKYDRSQGEKYFAGTLKFKNGGPACITCHGAGEIGALGGGTLGPDLTNAYSSYTDKGLTKVLKSINFPTMIKLYKKKKLTDDEIYQLKSHLWEKDRIGKVEKGYSKKFLFLGIIGFLLLLGFFDLVWKRRITTTRRRD